nr:hypothetical protein BHI3_08900 [Bacteriovorax sp. HI3]
MKDIRSIAPMFGNKPYQVHAQHALPILVRQAITGETMFYSDLALELGMANARNLNVVLGSIGTTLEMLSKSLKFDIPPIQCLVVNKQTGLPGEGIGWFITKKDFSKLSRTQKRIIVETKLSDIFLFKKWEEVLHALNLEVFKEDYNDLISRASRRGGESDNHKDLKDYILKNPQMFKLKGNNLKGLKEYPLPSGDFLDVSFLSKSEWVGIEAKSSISEDADLVRGLFQAVKYYSVMEAVNNVERMNKQIRVILVVEGELPKRLIPMKNTLGVEVIELRRTSKKKDFN